MNSSPSEFSSLAADQAALWAARCDGSDLSPADRAALQAWLGENPAHPILLAEYREVSSALKRHLPALAARGSVAPPRPSAPVRAGWSRGWLTVGALAAAALALTVWTGHPAGKPESISTPAAQRRVFTLDDGTQVELNAHSQLLVDTRSGKERHIALTNGEAYFVVAKDQSRPFVVETPAGSVRVTGTIFDVRAETRSELDVTVVEGSVLVRSGRAGASPAPVALHAGDRFSASAPTPTVQKLTASGLEDALAWREGQIVFAGTPLQAALDRFAHYYDRRVIASPAAASLRVGGRFNLDDLDGFLADLEVGLPVRVIRDPNNVVRVSLLAER